MSTGTDYMEWKQRALEAETQLASTREDVAEAVRRIDRIQAERDEWRTKALDAENHPVVVTMRAERDEARRTSRDLGAIISQTMDALEGEPLDNMVGLARARVGDLKRAEAGNAALLDAYRRTWGCVMHDSVLHSPACNADSRGDCTPECPALAVSMLLRADHPGAALLAEVEALRVALHDLVAWAKERWDAEVKHRPLANVDRTALDQTWKQVQARLGAAVDALPKRAP
jgi:hypothetical protein